jgi:hypothetical protein
MASPSLPLSLIVDVTVQVAAQAAAAPQFNQGLIIGPSAVIPSVGVASRTRLYLGLAGMLSDGFTSASPEYIAAQIYFSQSPAPQYLWIGRQDLTSLNTVVPHSGSEGTGYVVGDIITVVQVGASGGTLQVTAVGGSGQVTGVSILTDGTGYTVATGLPTSGGTGSGAEVDISVIGETPLTAVQACRVSSPSWWGCMVTDAATADNEAIAGFVQAMTPVGAYFCTTGDAAVLNNVTNNLGAYLKAAALNRTFVDYATTQGGAAPNNIYACAAVMGVMMGLNTGLPSSAFTMKFKLMTGIIPEPLTISQINAIEGNNVNLYLGYANDDYTIFEQGTTPVSGTYMDQILSRDIIAAAIQFNVMNLLVGTPSIPQTDPGETQLIHAVNQSANAQVITGWIAPGTWEGVTIINLVAGDPLPLGYLAQSYPYATQTPANRAARQAMPIYLAIIEAGATHSLLVGIYIQP